MALSRRDGRFVRIPPVILQPSRCQLGLCDGVLHMLVAEKELDGPRILLLVGELKAAAMPELMRVHWEPKRGDRSRVRDHLADTGSGQRSLPLGEKHLGRVGGSALQPSQGTHLPGRSEMYAGQAAFETTHVDKSLVEVELISAEVISSDTCNPWR